jgi:hypothetical protein
VFNTIRPGASEIEQHDAMYVAGTPWPVLRDETAASRPSWTLFLEFKEGVATVVEAVAEGCRAAADIRKISTG